MHLYGSRCPENEPLPYSSWSTPLQPVFAAIDTLKIGTFESQLEVTNDVAQLVLCTVLRDANGTAVIHAPQPASYWENSAFLPLGPEDSRRTAGSTDVVLGMGLGRHAHDGGADLSIKFDDLSYFIIPAESATSANGS